jgi:hypothetical protein
MVAGLELDPHQAGATLGIAGIIEYVRTFSSTSIDKQPEEILASLPELPPALFRNLNPLIRFVEAQQLYARDHISPTFHCEPRIVMPAAGAKVLANTSRTAKPISLQGEIATALAQRGIALMVLKAKELLVADYSVKADLYGFPDPNGFSSAEYIVAAAKDSDVGTKRQAAFLVVNAADHRHRKAVAELFGGYGAISTFQIAPFSPYDAKRERPTVDDAIRGWSNRSTSRTLTLPGRGYVELVLANQKDFASIGTVPEPFRELTVDLCMTSYDNYCTATNLRDYVIPPYFSQRSEGRQAPVMHVRYLTDNFLPVIPSHKLRQLAPY